MLTGKYNYNPMEYVNSEICDSENTMREMKGSTILRDFRYTTISYGIRKY